MQKAILILTLLVVGLFLIGCTENASNIPAEITDCQNQGKIIVSQDPRAIEDATTRETLYTNYVDKCILNKAMTSKNMELCTHLQKQENKSLCECEKLANLEKDTCYKQAAIDYNVGLHCFLIKDDAIMQNCLDNFE